MLMPRSFSSLQPVGVAAGEGLDQGGLAVVDVTGGAEGQAPLRHGPRLPRGRRWRHRRSHRAQRRRSGPTARWPRPRCPPPKAARPPPGRGRPAAGVLGHPGHDRHRGPAQGLSQGVHGGQGAGSGYRGGGIPFRGAWGITGLAGRLDGLGQADRTACDGSSSSGMEPPPASAAVSSSPPRPRPGRPAGSPRRARRPAPPVVGRVAAQKRRVGISARARSGSW